MASPPPAVIAVLAGAPWLSWSAALGVAVIATNTWNPVGGAAGAALFLGTILWNLAAVLIMVPAVFGDHEGGVCRRLLLNPVLQRGAGLSYGILLWHPVVLALLQGPWRKARWLGTGVPARLVVMVVLTLVAAWVTHRVVEEPLLRLSRRFSSAQGRTSPPEPDVTRPVLSTHG
jgi:peptidoglycan/LPS O-acetylase OafA/YrhL